jgi:hypothetical protein
VFRRAYRAVLLLLFVAVWSVHVSWAAVPPPPDSTCGPPAEIPDCTPKQSCDTPIARDARDCSRCLIQNPFGDSCISRGNDPVCEASKAAQNNAYAASKADCEANKTSQQNQCEVAKQSIVKLNAVRAAACQGGVFKCDIEDMLYSLDSQIMTDITFKNLMPDKILIYWLDYKGKRVLYNELTRGEQYTQHTYIAHPWVIADNHGRCIEVVLPRKDDTVIGVTE